MIACKNTNRIGIGIEKENKYYDIAIKIVDKFQVL
jgi:DNA modification methylase